MPNKAMNLADNTSASRSKFQAKYMPVSLPSGYALRANPTYVCGRFGASLVGRVSAA
jgi:hypothetical protein